jgi:CheY-like chemotaxis protein
MASDSNPGPLKELATSRARFIAELGERLATLRHGLGRVGSGTEATAELNAVRRRLHALAAAADVLHFTAAADALRRAELELTSLARAPSIAPARERVTRVLDLVPSLALGAPIDVHEELAAERTRSQREPLCLLVFGDVALEAALHKPGPLHGAETHRAHELDQLLTLLTRLGPDALVLDGDDAELVEFLPRLRQAAASNPCPWVAVGNFESYDAMLRLIRRGISRVLPKPVDAASLQRTLRLLVPRELPVRPRPNPFAELGSSGLADAIGSEARRAFLDPHSEALHAPVFSDDAGNQALAALWSAFARIRVLARSASEAGTRFTLEGPHGMIPLAPALGEGKLAGTPGSGVGEALAGRRFVVADADPTLLGALARALQRLGASVLPARDGAQALELCERQWPDALISDALLPSVDGFELCRRVRDDVALGDLPVALICWKEHLIEHARLAEQGSEPRPLDAESFAPLAEGLHVRMSLERRLERHDAVHGRLDGLTPRLLLQLACSRTPSALLSVRTGRLAVEVAVVDGRPIHARLLDAGAVAAEGPAALGPLLGMRVGRFSLEPLSSAPAPHFSGDVMSVLAPSIARARRARSWLVGYGVDELTRVELEPRVAALYADEAPAAQRALLSRLLHAESRRLVTSLAEASDADPSALGALLLELVRRGGVLALYDDSGRDVLEPDYARAAPPRGRASDTVVMPAALSLAEAVLQAVSAPTDYASDKPSARRTHPGLAPPSPPPEPFYPRKPTTPPPHPLLADARAASVPAEARASDNAPRSFRSPAPPEPSEPREVPEVWSSEPDLDEETDPGQANSGEASHSLDEEPSSQSGRRGRSAAGPVLVTLAAAGLAYVGMSVIKGAALERLGAAPSSGTLAHVASLDLVDSGELEPRAPATVLTWPASVPAPALDAGDAGSPLTASPPLARPEVKVSTELLDAPPEAGLLPGHGLLEVRTWEPQRIYVDGVFVGNYASRLVRLRPGTYRVRLAGARDIEESVQVQAGRRTRVWARTASSE